MFQAYYIFTLRFIKWDKKGFTFYKLYKLLHNSRIKRREIKDELQKINYTLGISIRSINVANLESRILGLDNRKYTPRINKELFGV